MSDDAPVDLTGIAAEVTAERVHALLLNRTPAILDDTSPDHDLFVETVRGVASEVVPITGSSPTDDAIRQQAVWCISLGVASHLEAAMFPEQQLGDAGRSSQLLSRYLGVLADLRRDGLPQLGGFVGSVPYSRGWSW